MQRIIVLIFVQFVFITGLIYSQNNQSLIKEGAPRVYIDCQLCDINYIKEKISLVNYVNDRRDADVHILFTTATTGSGGKEYTLYYIGQNTFANANDTIKFVTNSTDTKDNIRETVVKNIKIGLVRYIARSKVADQMTISFVQQEKREQPQIDDWNFWYFSTSLSSSFSGEESYKYSYLSGSVSANRVTDRLKLHFKISNSYNESIYKYGDDEIVSYRRSQNLSCAGIFTLSDHWSWGLWISAYRSTYSNYDLRTSVSPGVEYNLFPYSESNQKQLRINYKISPTYNKYSSETIYYKTSELLYTQDLSTTLTLVEPWGNISTTLSAGNYLHDFKKYEAELFTTVSWRIIKGLSLSIYGGYSLIRNQLNLERGDASLEEVLTQQKQLETNYSYWGGIGISFSFGSIYNNIVNQRFGSTSGGGGITISMSE